MVVSITLFLGIVFPLVDLFTVFIILLFLVRLVGAPMRLLWCAIMDLV